MWLQFFLENARFGINLFAALVFFAVGWLYFDAWQEAKEKKEQVKYLGFFILALSFLLAGTKVESSFIEGSLSGVAGTGISIVSLLGRLIGYLLIIWALIQDKLQSHPDIKKYSSGLVLSSTFMHSLSFITFLFPPLACLIGLLYLRRATIGYENHIKPIALAFFLLSISELFSLGELFRGSTNVGVFNLVAPFGVVWFLKYIFLTAAIGILGKWVFGYLLKRFVTQLFMIFASSILIIFLVTAISFSAILVGNIESEAFRRLETDVKVLSYAIDIKKSQTISDTALVAQNSQVKSQLANRRELTDSLENFLLSKDQSFLWAINSNGIVLARGEDAQKYGDSIAGDSLVQKALEGKEVSSIVVRDGPLAPVVTLRAASPMTSRGAIIAGTILDNAFVDGIKSATGLETSIYGGNKLSATTLVTTDGKTRPVGVGEEDRRVKENVLGKGEALSKAVYILGVPYLSSYLPLKDIEEKIVGMIFVGRPQATVLQTAASSIELTFVTTAILLVLAILPAYLISRYIVSQIR